MMTTILSTVPVFLAILVGIYARKKNLLGNNSEEVVAKLTFRIVNPFLIIYSLYRFKINSENINLVFAAVLIAILIIFFAFFWGKAMHKEKKTIFTLMVCYLGFAVGGFAYPFVEAGFPKIIFQNLILVDIILFLLLNFVGYPLSIHGGSSLKKLPVKMIIKKLVGNPVILAILFIFIINMLNLNLPKEVLSWAEFFGKSFGLLSSILIGLSLELSSLKKFLGGGFYFILRLIAGIIATLIVATMMGLNYEQSVPLYLAISVPFSSISLMFIQEQKLDSDFAARISAMSFLLGIIIYPLVIIILNGYCRCQ